MKKTLLGAVCALLAVAAWAQTNVPVVALTTNTVPTQWGITLGAAGLTAGDNILNDWQWGGELGVYRKIDLNLFQKKVRTDLGFRQTFGYGTMGYKTWTTTEEVDPPCFDGTETVTTTHSSSKSGWMFRSEIFYDFNFPIWKQLSFFAGPNFAVNYGWEMNPQWTVGPEGGLKWDFGKGWNVYTRASYDYNLSESDSGFRIGAGVGYEF